MIIGDLDRFRDASVRERLRERSRMRAVMAPKNARDVGDAGEDVVGDICPDESVDFSEPTVDVRRGGVGWKFVWSCDAMLAALQLHDGGMCV
jgi:hypothetical protein